MNTPSSPRFNTHSPARGFTLIELMIAVAIIAILTALAYPSYRNYVIRGQLVDATNGLSALRANMERFYQDNRSYATTGGFTSPCLAPASSLIVGNFQLSCASAPSSIAFQLAAVGQTPNTSAFTFYVDNNDTQSTVVASGAPNGWNSCTNAWVTKPGPAC